MCRYRRDVSISGFSLPWPILGHLNHLRALARKISGHRIANHAIERTRPPRPCERPRISIMCGQMAQLVGRLGTSLPSKAQRSLFSRSRLSRFVPNQLRFHNELAPIFWVFLVRKASRQKSQRACHKALVTKQRPPKTASFAAVPLIAFPQWSFTWVFLRARIAT